jgi:nucleoside-diphosphate-sugar epimerase
MAKIPRTNSEFKKPMYRGKQKRQHSQEGTGFLGGHVVKHLLDQGEDLVIVDNLFFGSTRNLLDLDIRHLCVEGDLRDYDFAVRVLREVDTVYHLAAKVGGVSYLHGFQADELAALQTNLLIDTNVFRAHIQNKVRCIVHASSVAVCASEGNSQGDQQCREEETGDEVDPEGGYGWVKLLGEKQLSLMSRVNVRVTRILVVNGYSTDRTVEIAKQKGGPWSSGSTGRGRRGRSWWRGTWWRRSTSS